MQTELVPGALTQFGIAVATLWLVLQIVREFRNYGKGQKSDLPTVKIELVSDPIVNHRLDRMESDIKSFSKEFVTRNEYDSRDKGLREQLGRIESKLDNMWGSRRVFTGDKQDP